MRRISFILTLCFCCISSALAAPKLGKQIKLDSKFLSQSRNIYVALPNDYQQERYYDYPVLYLTDAEEQFDHIASTINYLAGTISPMIVVGIPQQQRFNELMPYNGQKQPNPDSEKFRQFITEEVKPYIDANYRTAEFNLLSGHSIGGAFTLNAYIQSPKDFDVFLALTPTLAWGNEQILNELPQQLSATTQPKVFSYFEGLSPFPTPKLSHDKLTQLFANVQDRQLSFQSTLLEHEDHMSLAHLGSYLALTQLYRGWFLSVPELVDDKTAFNRHYQVLSQRLGYAVKPTENEAWQLVQALLSAKLQAQAEYVATQVLEMYPASFFSYVLLADTAKHQGNVKKEKRYLQQAIAHASGDTTRQARYQTRLNALN